MSLLGKWNILAGILGTSKTETASEPQEATSLEIVSTNLDFPIKHKTEKEFLRRYIQEEQEESFMLAAHLLHSKLYESALKAYKLLKEKYPAESAICDKQIGKAYYELGNYKKALRYYISANVRNPELQLEENIYKCCLTLMEECKNETRSYWIDMYESLYPEGKYLEILKEHCKN